MYGYILDFNNQQGDDSLEELRIVKEFYLVLMLRLGLKEVFKSFDVSDFVRRRMNSFDNFISRQLSRSGFSEEEEYMYDDEVDRINIKND